MRMRTQTYLLGLFIALGVLVLSGCTTYGDIETPTGCEQKYPDAVDECKKALKKRTNAELRRAEMKQEYAECVLWEGYGSHTERNPSGHCRVTREQAKRWARY